jgi:hypothetical protein
VPIRACQLISGVVRTEQLRAPFEAFDQASEAVAADVGEEPVAIEVVRRRRANAILGLADNGDLDAAQLKKAELQLISGTGRQT